MIFGKPAIMTGKVVHERVRPLHHRLEYGVFSILVDAGQLQELDKTPFFSVDRFNLLSLHRADMADGSREDLAQHARDLVRRETGREDIVSVWLLTYPRLLGFVFNPLSVYFCLDSERQPVAAVYEVSNTFGDRTSYVCRITDGRVEPAGKRMLVSPFNEAHGHYNFGLALDAEKLTVGVALHEGGKPVLKTFFKANAAPFSGLQIIKSALAFPFMTLKVVAAIHYEAAKLWLKGLRFPQRVGLARREQAVSDEGKDRISTRGA
ncbi:MAG: DUF1365 domain-containing protein [Nitratireductor sp.]|nr:DUF1365 domain-containing protein [Nitratireductor sp.]